MKGISMSKETNIFLIRHSEQLKIGNKVNQYENSQISNEKIILSVTGEKKAEAISKMEELQSIDALWCSNYVRAIATAKYIANQNNIDIKIDERLNERKLRRFRGFKRIWKRKKEYIYNRTIIRHKFEKYRRRK